MIVRILEIILVLPAICYLIALSLLAQLRKAKTSTQWAAMITCFLLACSSALTCAVLAWSGSDQWTGFKVTHAIGTDRLSASLGLMTTFLGLVIAKFSSKYLRGEHKQLDYMHNLCATLACIQLVLMANHWGVLIIAWSGSGYFLQKLICFYPNRPLATLAALKKQTLDRTADILLIMAAACTAWLSKGNPFFDGLDTILSQSHDSSLLTTASIALILAVAIRSALIPFHGWILQVLESPTPVSALLHAGLVNLGGYVLIRLHPLLDFSSASRWLLIMASLSTALLSALVATQQYSTKSRLAWSTISQMGFMLLECALGLYILAVLHLVGHSLYKSFKLLSSQTVESVPCKQSAGGTLACAISVLAPVLTTAVIGGTLLGLSHTFAGVGIPTWWLAVLALTWSPLFWLQSRQPAMVTVITMSGTAIQIALMTSIAWFGHQLNFGFNDNPFHTGGMICAVIFSLSYLSFALIALRPGMIAGMRHQIQAGFYIDDLITCTTQRLGNKLHALAFGIHEGIGFRIREKVQQ